MSGAALEVSTLSTLELLRICSSNPAPWRKGLPPGNYYPGMADDYDLSFTLAGPKWHRKRTPDQKAAYLELFRRNRAAMEAGERTPLR